jgi:hypothetical protein
MTNGLLIYGEIFAHFHIYDFATARLWIPYIWGNFYFLFYQCIKLSIFLSIPVCRRSSLLSVKEGDGVGSHWAESHDRKKTWPSKNYSILSEQPWPFANRCAWIFKHSMGVRNRVGLGLRTGPPGFIVWRNRFRGIDSWAPEKFKNTGSGAALIPPRGH